MSSKPSFVLVPGAWHSPETWDKVVSRLEAQGHPCVPVTLPTTLGDSARNFTDDLNAVRDAIVGEVTHGRDVVVVVHSYGSVPGCSALKGFTGPPSNPDHGRVVGFFMIATGFAVSNMTFMEMLGGTPPPFWVADYESGFANLVADSRGLFYNDLPEDEGKLWVSKLCKHSMRAFTEGGAGVYAGWADVPVWFLATTEDRGNPIEMQRMFVQKAKDDGADVTLRELPTSHSPMLSKPDETVAIMLDAAADFVSKKSA